MIPFLYVILNCSPEIVDDSQSHKQTLWDYNINKFEYVYGIAFGDETFK